MRREYKQDLLISISIDLYMRTEDREANPFEEADRNKLKEKKTQKMIKNGILEI